MLVGVCASVQSLHVLWVHRDGCGGIFEDFVPIAKGIVASGSVRVVDWIGFAEDGFAIEIDGLIVVFGTIRFVAGGLQFACVCFSILSKVSRSHYVLSDMSCAPL